MRIARADPELAKGWYFGSWNSDLEVSIGYANAGVDEPHLHQAVFEIYLVACGVVEIRVEKQSIHLQTGEIILIEPGEAHTFLSSSPAYFHFVIHTPALQDDDAHKDKVLVPCSRLGL